MLNPGPPNFFRFDEIQIGDRRLARQNWLGQAQESPIAAIENAEIARENAAPAAERPASRPLTAATGNPAIDARIAGIDSEILRLQEVAAGIPELGSPPATPSPDPPPPENVTRFSPPPAERILFEGTIINAVLETALNSQLPGFVRARVVRNVYDSKLSGVAIPKGGGSDREL